MFKDAKIKNIVFTAIIIITICFIMWAFFVKKNKAPLLATESSFDEPNNGDQDNDQNQDIKDLPGLFQLQYSISTKGKKAVFPIILEKITPGPIELPNRRSLLNKDAKYKFIDIMPGDKIKVVSIQYLTYTVDHNVFNDNFLVTDNDYLIAYTQAKEHFKKVIN